MITRVPAIAILVSAVLLADSVSGIHWTPPAAWKAMGERPMRAATYDVPPVPGDQEHGECIVNYFGAGQGGPVDANLKRWTGQFEGGEKNAKTVKRTIHGLNVSTLDVAGAYTGMGGPMMQAKAPKAGYRMLGAIVEAPQGSVFFKFAGPAKTVAGNQAKFDAMIESVSK